MEFEWKKVGEKFLKGFIKGTLLGGAVIIPTDVKEAVATAATGLALGLVESALNWLKHRAK